MTESERQALMVELMREAGSPDPEGWHYSQPQSFALALIYLYAELKRLRASQGEPDAA